MKFPAKSHIRSVSALLIAMGLTSFATAQTTWYVDDDNCPGPGDGSIGNPFCVIQDAVDAAKDGDVVVIHPGLYSENVTIRLDIPVRSFTIRSTEPQNPAIVDQTVLTTAASSSVFTLGPGFAGKSLILDGLTFKDQDLGITCISASLTIHRCVFLDGAPGISGGGAIVFRNMSSDPDTKTLTVTNCTFIKNTAHTATVDVATAIFPYMCDITDCVFIGNDSEWSGAIRGSGGTVSISRCSFHANQSIQVSPPGTGGAIHWSTPNQLSITDCHFSGNRSEGNGGAIYLTGSAFNTTTVMGCTFEGNVSGLFGGGIHVDGTQINTSITCNRFDGNCAAQGGGGIEFDISGASYADNRFCYNLPFDVLGTATDLGGNRTACEGQVAFNEDCKSASEIFEGATPFTTTGTGDNGPDLDISCDEGHGVLVMSDVWFRYEAHATGLLTVSTCDDADFDTRLAAYLGHCAGPTLIACNDEGPGCLNGTSLMELSVTKGETYLIRVGSSGGAQGEGTLTLTLAACPDFTGDGVVDVLDLIPLLAAWGTCP